MAPYYWKPGRVTDWSLNDIGPITSCVHVNWVWQLFCVCRQIIHLVAQSVICLILMRVLYPGVMEKSVLFFAMAYLCVCHLNRMMYDYGGYTLDITGSVTPSPPHKVFAVAWAFDRHTFKGYACKALSKWFLNLNVWYVEDSRCGQYSLVQCLVVADTETQSGWV